MTSALATISEPVVLDATRQPGHNGVPLIELNGTDAGASASGLTITAGGSTVRGLVINRFSAFGISISTTGNSTISGNYLGTNAAGSAVSANTVGIYIFGGANNNTIGGTVAGARNILSGNTIVGIQIDGSTGTALLGNYVGINAAGTAILANGTTGICLLNNANNTTIGGTAAGAGNVISGNVLFGVTINGSTGASILGNYVGTNPAGTAALGNGSGFYLFNNSSNNVIGGTNLAARNIISGNIARHPVQCYRQFCSGKLHRYERSRDICNSQWLRNLCAQ